MPAGETTAATGEPVLPPGTLLEGRYRIEREIGRGAMGCVFVAHDIKLGRDVAIKVVRPGAHDPVDLARLAREARTAGALAHANIVSIHDVGAFRGSSYLVQELLHGRTLRQELQGKPLPVERVVDLGLQLARGLAAAHEKGIVHRDIKPENLFLTSDGTLKILDFGIATLHATPEVPRSWTAPSPQASFTGTPDYMSPEQIQGREVDGRSDLFSVGLVLYEMLSGHPAFARPSAIETAWAILNEPPKPLPPEVPGPLGRIVVRCLEKAPPSRPQSARDLAQELEASQMPTYSDRGRRVALAVLATLVATLVLVLALSLRRSRSQTDFRQVTFQRGAVLSARFAPDAKTVFYAVSVDTSPPQLYSSSIARPEPRRLDGPPASLLAVSAKGELAVLLRPQIARYGYDRGTLARFFPDGSAPRELLEDVEGADWTPDGSALAVLRKVESGMRLEYPIDHVLYETSGWISHLRFSPDGSQIAFLSHPTSRLDSGVVMVSDLAGSVRAVTPAWRSVFGLSWAKAGTEIWFTAAAANSSSPHLALRAVSASGMGEGRVLARVAGDLTLQDIAGDGRALLTKPEQRLGLAIVKADNPKPQDFSWFDRTFLGDLSADGSQVLFSVDGPATGQKPAVYLRSLQGSSPVRLGEGYGSALSPDGRWAVSLSSDTSSPQPLTLMPTGPGEARSVDVDGLTVVRVRWFRDGRRILIAGTEPGRGMTLYVLPIDGGKPKAISGEGISITGLGVSPDGAFVAAGDAHGRTTLYPVEGGNAVPLPEVDPDQVPFGFSDDGSLFVGRLRGMSVPVYRFNVQRRQKSLVTTLRSDPPGAILRVAISPDASTFAFNYASAAANLYELHNVE